METGTKLKFAHFLKSKPGLHVHMSMLPDEDETS